MPSALKFMYPTSGVTFNLGNGEEVVLMIYGTDSCACGSACPHCVRVCVCVDTKKHTHIFSCNNTPSANTRNDVTMPSKYFLYGWYDHSATASNFPYKMTCCLLESLVLSDAPSLSWQTSLFWQQAMHNRVRCRKQTTVSKTSQLAAWW